VKFRHCILFFCLLPVVCAPLRAQQQQPQPQEAPGAPPTSPASERPQPPPPLPPAPEVPRQDENTLSIEGDGWAPGGSPIFNKGAQTTNAESAYAPLGGKTKFNYGAVARVPAGKHNTFRITYFQARTDSAFTAPASLNLWGTGLNPGDYIYSNYRVQSVNASFDFLTWPYPPSRRRFRLKTLWQFQYVGVQSGFTAPLSTASPDTGSGSKSIILPGLGLGASYYLSNNARFEANASGFDIPHHSAIASADADFAYKFGYVEVRAGMRLLYFKTSPQADFYMKGRLDGAFVGLRLYLR
jgi:hypothetical protein